ncbi:hypothetical protein NLJ89_g9385 [Agrocybe chaxingu]|uniref:Uncharacterized protein n=1 Tax=Agrocybe chaxingu TaxID=84603 RepID=A0A9W8MRA2_9AGAR|nr:hypothetical protein NLJ89_g9385 [Agrocybe chaxingu]
MHTANAPFSWGTSINIPMPAGAQEAIAQWPSLRFSPVGLYDLCRHLGALPHTPSIYNLYKRRFDLADMAWFAQGSATKTDIIQKNKFHSEFEALRDDTPSGDLGTDARSKLRVFAIHVAGTTRPGSPKDPQYVKANVFFPDHLLREEPHLRTVLGNMVQQFIVEVGIPTIMRYEHCTAKLFKLKQTSATNVRPLMQHGDFPTASPPGSCNFVFHGHPLTIVSSAPGPSSQPAPAPADDDDDDEYLVDEYTSSQVRMANYLQQVAEMKMEITQYKTILGDKEKELEECRIQISELTLRVSALMGEHDEDSSDRFSTTESSISSTTAFSNPTLILNTHRPSPNVTIRLSRPQSPATPTSCRVASPFSTPSRRTPTAAASRLGPISQRSPLPGFQNSGQGGPSQVPHGGPSDNTGDPRSSATTEEYVTFLAEYSLSAQATAIMVVAQHVLMFSWRGVLLRVGISEQVAEIDEEVRRWKATTLNLATELGRRFDKKPCYFLDLFFQGGVHLVKKQNKPNVHNAYVRMKADTLRDQGEVPTLEVLHRQEFKDEYNALTEAERAELVASHQDSNLDRHRKRPTAKSRIQDIMHTLKNIKMMLQSLNMRVGVEAFFCVVRNTPDYHMDPIWFFTSKAMKNYMPIAVPIRTACDFSHVGTKLEAFAIASCDTINLNRTSKQKADDMKRQIRDKINQMLMDITDNEQATMQYVNYEELVVQRYSVELVGWTCEKFINPSELSTSLPPLRRLLDAINNQECKFVKLTPLQLKKRRAEQQKKIDEGVISVKTRKPRKDKGTKRKRKGDDSGDTESDKENAGRSEEPQQKKRQKKTATSKETIEPQVENKGANSV